MLNHQEKTNHNVEAQETRKGSSTQESVGNHSKQSKILVKRMKKYSNSIDTKRSIKYQSLIVSIDLDHEDEVRSQSPPEKKETDNISAQKEEDFFPKKS